MSAVKKAVGREISASLRRIGDAAALGQLTDAQLLDLIRKSPLGAQLAGSANEARHQLREQLVAERDAELEQLEKALPAAKRKAEETATALAQAQAQLRAADQAHRETTDTLRGIGVRTQFLTGAINAQLARLAPPAIDAFIARMDSEFQSLRRSGMVVAVHQLSPNPHDSSDPTILANRLRAQESEETKSENQRRGWEMDGRLAAQAEAEQLKYRDLAGEELDAELVRIEADLVELGKARRAAMGG